VFISQRRRFVLKLFAFLEQIQRQDGCDDFLMTL